MLGATGDMVWFNVCLSMFERRPLFDALLLPAIENPTVAAIRFVLDESQRPKWELNPSPKVIACGGADKVTAPGWSRLKEDVSFILADTRSHGASECLLGFWREPFMSRQVGRDVPRYIFHVTGHSDLVERLAELDREHRFSRWVHPAARWEISRGADQKTRPASRRGREDLGRNSLPNGQDPRARGAGSVGIARGSRPRLRR